MVRFIILNLLFFSQILAKDFEKNQRPFYHPYFAGQYNKDYDDSLAKYIKSKNYNEPLILKRRIAILEDYYSQNSEKMSAEEKAFNRGLKYFAGEALKANNRKEKNNFYQNLTTMVELEVSLEREGKETLAGIILNPNKLNPDRTQLPATNLTNTSEDYIEPTIINDIDNSGLNPSNSIFWKEKPETLYTCPDQNNAVFTFKKYKQGKGSSHTCFKAADSTGGEWKIKLGFGEARTEPFAINLLNELGYRVDTTCHLNKYRVHFDEEIIKNFYVTDIARIGQAIYSTHNTGYPMTIFQTINSFILKNGKEIAPQELHYELFKDEIEFIEFKEGTAEYLPKDGYRAGPWAFDLISHMDYREIRALKAVFALIQNFDTKEDNNRILLVKKPDDTFELKGVVHDLGGCLGRSFGSSLQRTRAVVSDFPEIFAEVLKNPVEKISDIKILYNELGYIRAFSRMTFEDAKWITRIISERLTYSKISEFLKAGGYTGYEHEKYLTLLNNRIMQMKSIFLSEYTEKIKF